MSEDRHEIGRAVAGFGGAMLVVSVFLTWYSLNLADILGGLGSRLPTSGSGLTLSWSGWNSVHTLRFVLLLVGAAVLMSSLARPSTGRTHQGWLLLGGGLLVAALALYRIESPPGALDVSVGPFQFPSPAGAGALLSHLVHVRSGAWVALVGGRW